MVRYTQTTPEEAAKADVLIIDCFGLLSSMYNYGDVAYIGGGFGVGIHNTLEAAVWNMPVIFGPNNKKFQEAQGLLKSGGGFEINTCEPFGSHKQGFGQGYIIRYKRITLCYYIIWYSDSIGILVISVILYHKRSHGFKKS